MEVAVSPNEELTEEMKQRIKESAKMTFIFDFSVLKYFSKEFKSKT
jgi:hypothetical protein